MAAEPPYDHAGPSIRASDEVNGLLREQGKIRQQFSGLLGATAIGRGAGSLPAELYWELLDVDDHGVVTLGRVLQPWWSRRHLSIRRRPLLCQRRLLCRVSPFISCGPLRSKENLLRSFGAAT